VGYSLGSISEAYHKNFLPQVVGNSYTKHVKVKEFNGEENWQSKLEERRNTYIYIYIYIYTKRLGIYYIAEFIGQLFVWSPSDADASNKLHIQLITPILLTLTPATIPIHWRTQIIGVTRIPTDLDKSVLFYLSHLPLVQQHCFQTIWYFGKHCWLRMTVQSLRGEKLYWSLYCIKQSGRWLCKGLHWTIEMTEFKMTIWLLPVCL
jgi:hypothetical protein